ncbi:MAG: EthD domain-containing protein [Deltaproteobacteria bacterium]|nr:EthD domain-containing protein [Deltaproteobacteria bacterium]
MIKYIICATRKAGMTREEFSAYWRHHHGPLVKSVPEFTRHVRKYVQCHIVGDAVPLGTAAAYDGVAELWFDSPEDLVKAFNEPRYLEVIRPDELKFVDLHQCISFITEEVSVV